jgi:hypothetical protein
MICQFDSSILPGSARQSFLFEWGGGAGGAYQISVLGKVRADRRSLEWKKSVGNAEAD